MIFHRKLNSLHVIENESVGESKINLFRWTYPTIEDGIREFIISTCFISFPDNVYFCIKKKGLWIYIYQWQCNEKNRAVVLTAREFDPRKYKMLCTIFSREYAKHENPVELVKLYLNVFIKGSCVLQENGAPISYNLHNFKSRRGLNELIKLFGSEIMFLYNAILLKKRVLVYHPNIESLQQVLYAMISLVSKRNVDEYLEPFIDNVKLLRGRPFYLAGTTENSFVECTDCYDVFIDLGTAELKMPPHSKEALAVTKMHEELASFIIEMSNNGKTDDEIINVIDKKTEDFMSHLENFATVTENGMKIITVNDLKNKKLSPSVENFFFHLGVAEDMMML